METTPIQQLKLRARSIADNMEFQPPRGTRDFLPEEMIKRKYVIDTITAVFEKWGFDPLETPAFEEWSLLSLKGGDAIKNEIYYFKDKSDRELGLRFDLTVPFARVIVNNPNLPKPFRRYHVGPVWRYDRPGAGRFREFRQADVDIAGAPVGEADALCVAVACAALKALGLSEFFVRISNRKIVEAYLVSLGLKEPAVDIMRSIDKLEKIGSKNVSDELREKKIPAEKIKKIMDFIEIKKLDEVKGLVQAVDIGKEGLAELDAIIGHVNDLGFSDYIHFDISLVRGLEYYTGPVFEINAGVGMSVGGGGRYDGMIESFGGKPTPAVGISLGIDRLALVLGDKMKAMRRTNTSVYLVSVAGSARGSCIRMAEELIGLGVPTEFDVMDRSVSKQMDYANSKGVPYVIVMGEKEIAAGAAKLRDMKSGAEHEIRLTNLEDVRKIVKHS
jgi:histidyl-tRNA synthetase